MKLLGLAPWQIDSLATAENPAHDAVGLFAALLPQVLKARTAQGRLEQRIALLRHVEALRLYASDHDGRLPAKLSEATVPLPADPFTGKAFGYNLDGATAHLQGAASQGQEKSSTQALHYEITVRK
jgi:hypothetical protein